MSHEHFQFLPFLPFCTSLLCIFSSLHSDGVQCIFTGHPEAFQASKLLLELGPEQFAGSTDAGPEKMSTKKTKKKHGTRPDAGYPDVTRVNHLARVLCFMHA